MEAFRTDVDVMKALDAFTERARRLYQQRPGVSIREVAMEVGTIMGQRNYQAHQLNTLLAFALAELAHKQHCGDSA